MEITFLARGLSKVEEDNFVDYVAKKVPAIENLLKKFAPDAKLLNASIKKFEKHSAYEVEFCLKLMTKSIVGKETSHSITKAVDLAKDRLIAQIKKHLDHMRDGHLRDGRSHKSVREDKKQETFFSVPIEEII